MSFSIRNTTFLDAPAAERVREVSAAMKSILADKKPKYYAMGKKSVKFVEVEGRHKSGKRTNIEEKWRKYVAQQFKQLHKRRRSYQDRALGRARGRKTSSSREDGPSTSVNTSTESFVMPEPDHKKRKKIQFKKETNSSGSATVCKRKESKPQETTSSTEGARNSNDGENTAILKRPLNAYIIFSQCCRLEFNKLMIPSFDSRLMSTVLGHVWRFLSKDERHCFYEQAGKLQQQYYENKKRLTKDDSPESDAKQLKKPLNAFMLFCQEQRAEMQPKTTALSGQRAAKKIAKMWNKMSPREKQTYVDRAAQARADYEEKLKELRQQSSMPAITWAKSDEDVTPKGAARLAPESGLLTKVGRNNNKWPTDSDTDGSQPGSTTQIGQPAATAPPRVADSPPPPHPLLAPQPSAPPETLQDSGVESEGEGSLEQGVREARACQQPDPGSRASPARSEGSEASVSKEQKRRMRQIRRIIKRRQRRMERAQKIAEKTEKSKQAGWKDELYPWNTFNPVSNVLCDEDICTRLYLPVVASDTSLCLYPPRLSGSGYLGQTAGIPTYSDLHPDRLQLESLLSGSSDPGYHQARSSRMHPGLHMHAPGVQDVYARGSRSNGWLQNAHGGCCQRCCGPTSSVSPETRKGQIQAALLKSEVDLAQCSSSASSDYDSCPFVLPDVCSSSSESSVSHRFSNFNISSYGSQASAPTGCSSSAASGCCRKDLEVNVSHSAIPPALTHKTSVANLSPQAASGILSKGNIMDHCANKQNTNLRQPGLSSDEFYAKLARFLSCSEQNQPKQPGTEMLRAANEEVTMSQEGKIPCTKRCSKEVSGADEVKVEKSGCRDEAVHPMDAIAGELACTKPPPMSGERGGTSTKRSKTSSEEGKFCNSSTKEKRSTAETKEKKYSHYATHYKKLCSPDCKLLRDDHVHSAKPSSAVDIRRDSKALCLDYKYSCNMNLLQDFMPDSAFLDGLEFPGFQMDSRSIPGSFQAGPDGLSELSGGRDSRSRSLPNSIQARGRTDSNPASLQQTTKLLKRTLKRKYSYDSLEVVNSSNDFGVSTSFASSLPKYAFKVETSTSKLVHNLGPELSDDLKQSIFSTRSSPLLNIHIPFDLELEFCKQKGWIL